MLQRLHTTYSMLGRNGRMPFAAPQSPLQPQLMQPQPDADIDSEDSIDLRFN
jgi:hypothetical protein